MNPQFDFILVQDSTVSAYPIIKHLIDNNQTILKNNIERIVVLGQSGTTWQEEFTSLRMPLLSCQVNLEFGNYEVPEIPKDKPTIILPLTDELSKAYSKAYLEEYSTQVNIPTSHWRPTGTTTRVISSYLVGFNDEVDMKSICKLDPKSKLIKELSDIENLNIDSIPIDCKVISKYALDKSLFKDHVKSYLVQSLEDIPSDVYAIRSLSKTFNAKFYIENDEYYQTFYDSHSTFRPLSSLIFDIKNYSLAHPEDTIFIQPYYRGIEIVVNFYQDDSGSPVVTAFKMNDDSGNNFQCCYDDKLTTLCIALGRRLKLKHYSFRTIRLSNGDYALIDLKYSFNKYLAATLKYQSDFISYELTRGLYQENDRLKYLNGKYLDQYTDKIFKSTLIF